MRPEPNAASLTMQPEKVSELFDPRVSFEKRCLNPKSRCGRIMLSILKGVSYDVITDHWHMEPNDIRVYALCLKRAGYDVKVPDFVGWAAKVDPEVHVRPRLAAVTQETIDEVKRLRHRLPRKVIMQMLGLSLATYDDIVYFIRHGHWRYR